MTNNINDLKKLSESEDHVEFKEAKHNYPFAGGQKTDPKERRRCVLGYIVALANEKGGKLVLGMADKCPHDVVGSDFAVGSEGKLQDEVYTRLGLRVKTTELFENGKRVLVIDIPSRPIGRLLKFEGVALMRVGESLREMSDSEMFAILSEQEPDFSAKICEGLKIKDLDKKAISLLKQKYAAKQKNDLFLTLPTSQLLSDLDLSVGSKLTYAALILLGDNEAIRRYLPHNKITVEFRVNPASIEYSARQEFQEALFTGIDHAWDYLNQPASNPQLHYQDGPYIFDIPSYSEKSVREALLNAVCHRSYLIHSDVMVKQSPDSLEISNAGGFPIGVDLENILTTNSVPRNKLLCDVLQKTGLIERSGQGVDKMFYQCIVDGKELPSYENTDAFQVSIRFTAAIKSGAFLKYIRSVQKRLGRSKALSVQELVALQQVCFGRMLDSNNAAVLQLEKKRLVCRIDNRIVPEEEYQGMLKLENKPEIAEVHTGGNPENPHVNPHVNPYENSLDEQIVSEIRRNAKVTISALAELCGKNRDTIRVHLKALQEQGIVTRIGPDKGGHWEIV